MKIEYGDDILETAAKMFQEKGVIRVSMEDLSTEMGISTSTVYSKYSSKKLIISVLAEAFFLSTQYG